MKTQFRFNIQFHLSENGLTKTVLAQMPAESLEKAIEKTMEKFKIPREGIEDSHCRQVTFADGRWR